MVVVVLWDTIGIGTGSVPGGEDCAGTGHCGKWAEFCEEGGNGMLNVVLGGAGGG